jgi:predicted flap endonuclease-1-like 5' DNA nuclease
MPAANAPSRWTFHLNPEDAVVAAPSIGPKTAKQLAAIGIQTVADLLTTDAEELVRRLGHKRLQARQVRQWQQQATLATRVPLLRGHDAQILVALGITLPEQLAQADPHKLWAEVEPFVASKPGKRILRGSQTPDFSKVKDWVRYAAAARTTKAA